MKKLLLLPLLLCGMLAAQSPVVQVVSLDSSFVVLHADGSIVVAKSNGDVIDLGQFKTTSTTVRGLDFSMTFKDINGDPHTVRQNCKSLSLKVCIKQYIKAIQEVKLALKEAGLL